jgi:3-oxoacyl-[acyl-carrier protein] reductase
MDAKVAVVSGASRGLGLALAEGYLACGHAVAAFSRSGSDELERVAAKAESGGQFFWAGVDGSDREAVRDFARQVVDRYGRVDVLINNAAVGLEGLFTLSRPPDISRVVDVNLLGPIWLTQACAKVMLTQQSGSIVVISSINAARGHAGVSVYSATKAALEGMTRSLARELGPKNIRVNAVAPGFFESDMVKGLSAKQKEAITRRTALKRLPGVANIVDAVMFLTSDQAALITGQTIAVDGGMSC